MRKDQFLLLSCNIAPIRNKF